MEVRAKSFASLLVFVFFIGAEVSSVLSCDLKGVPAFESALKEVESGLRVHLGEFTPGIKGLGDVVCKNWSAYPSQVIWVKLFKRSIRKDVDQIAALVGLFDFKKKEMQGTVFHSQFGVQSFVKLKYLDIDTARYQVSDKQRGFGIKAGYISAADQNLAKYEILSLYLPVQDGLKLLVEGVVLQNKFGEKGKKGCLMAYSEATSTMSMVAKPGKKLKSFRIARNSKSFAGKRKKGRCLKVNPKSSSEKFDLDPPEYSVPEKYKHKFGY